MRHLRCVIILITNMCIKQNALDFAAEYPDAANIVEVIYRRWLPNRIGLDGRWYCVSERVAWALSKGGFLLYRWNSNNPSILESIAPKLRDAQSTLPLSNTDQYTKTLGLEWNSAHDKFCLTVSELLLIETITKRFLLYDVAKTFDISGYNHKGQDLASDAPVRKVGRDDPLPKAIVEEWLWWRNQLPLLSSHHMPRCYFSNHINLLQWVMAFLTPLRRPTQESYTFGWKTATAPHIHHW